MKILLGRPLLAKAYYSYDYNGFNMRPHSHDSLELMYVDRGAAQIDICGKRLSLKKGQLIAIGFLVPHRLYIREGSACRILNLEIGYGQGQRDNSAFLLNAATELDKADDYVVLDDESGLRETIKRLLNELTGSNESILSELYLYELINLLARYYTRASSIGNPHVKRAAEYISREFCGELSAADVAAEVKLNPAYLQRQFKLFMGVTMGEYITNLRIERAKALMASTNLPLTDIAAEVGYNNRQNFYKAFTKKMGISPSGYLKRVSAEAAARYIQSPYEK